MLNSLVFLLHSFEALTRRRPSQDFFYQPQISRAVAGLTPSMVLTADTWHTREKTKCQAFVMSTTCFRHCQPPAFWTSDFTADMAMRRRKGSWGRTERFQGKSSKNKLQFPSSPGSTPETSLPETKQREEGWGWILCFTVYLNSTRPFTIDLGWNIVISASAQKISTCFGICSTKQFCSFTGTLWDGPFPRSF